jgi:hypothetical protein
LRLALKKGNMDITRRQQIAQGHKETIIDKE